MFDAKSKTGTLIALLALTCSGASAQLADKEEDQKANKTAEKFFDAKLGEKAFPDGRVRDFGVLQRGTIAYHAFRVVNPTDGPLKIVSVRISMNIACSARSTKSVLQPNEEGKVEVSVDTAQFIGPKTQTVYVVLENEQILTEVRLFISAVSLGDSAFFPPSLDFGAVRSGNTVVTQMIVTYPAEAKVQVTGAKCDNEHIEVKLHELDRGPTQRSYQVSATVRGALRAGKLHTYVELTTNNPAMPRLRVPLRVEVESAPPRQ